MVILDVGSYVACKLYGVLIGVVDSIIGSYVAASLIIRPSYVETLLSCPVIKVVTP